MMIIELQNYILNLKNDNDVRLLFQNVRFW